MFLRERARQLEYCDRQDLPLGEVAANYQQLARFNRLALLADPFTRLLVRWLGRERVARLTLLDLGAGDGSLAEQLESWARARGWDWQVTSLDMNWRALGLRSRPRRVAASVCALPFPDASFDVVIASQMAHHLTETQAVQHFREAWRVTRETLFLTDTHRNAGALCFVWLLLRTLRVTPHFFSDGLLSVRRGWRLKEWRALAAQAEIPSARISLYYGSRVFLQARKGLAENARTKGPIARPKP
ncbi:MAG TPA: methyltransferase domain-containing protein [Verrucomicrobiae bacterium]|nr:methyltransferase domain-containing protein [Verrucomicrobiae bacterium]